MTNADRHSCATHKGGVANLQRPFSFAISQECQTGLPEAPEVNLRSTPASARLKRPRAARRFAVLGQMKTGHPRLSPRGHSSLQIHRQRLVAIRKHLNKPLHR